MAVGNIGRMRTRDSLVPRYDIQYVDEINDNFLRDAIESIAQFYNFQYPRDVSMSYYLPHTCTLNILSH